MDATRPFYHVAYLSTSYLNMNDVSYSVYWLQNRVDIDTVAYMIFQRVTREYGRYQRAVQCMG